MLLLYLGVFTFWKSFPSRAGFVCGGLAVAGLMAAGIWWAARRGYFANLVDMAVHAYVAVDVILEGLMYEVLRIVQPGGSDALLRQFHDNKNFFFCAAMFSVLIGGHRWYALARRESAARERADAVVADMPLADQELAVAGR
jgi:hypothetical protein